MSDIAVATRTVISKYAVFSGRASRQEYWWWVLAMFLLFAVLRVVDGVLVAPLIGFAVFAPNAGQPLSMLAALLLVVPAISVGVRRLHDIGKSGWWVLVGLVPVLGTVILLYYYVQRGNEGPNQYGVPEPLFGY